MQDEKWLEKRDEDAYMRGVVHRGATLRTRASSTAGYSWSLHDTTVDWSVPLPHIHSSLAFASHTNHRPPTPPLPCPERSTRLRSILPTELGLSEVQDKL